MTKGKHLWCARRVPNNRLTVTVKPPFRTGDRATIVHHQMCLPSCTQNSAPAKDRSEFTFANP